MDRKFMEEYYKTRYEDPVTEICGSDVNYKKLCDRSYHDIEEIENRIKRLSIDGKDKDKEEVYSWLETVTEEINGLINITIDNLCEKYTYIIQMAYLQGAYDRERMLKL